jgi:hypothetical protein
MKMMMKIFEALPNFASLLQTGFSPFQGALFPPLRLPTFRPRLQPLTSGALLRLLLLVWLSLPLPSAFSPPLLDGFSLLPAI